MPFWLYNLKHSHCVTFYAWFLLGWGKGRKGGKDGRGDDFDHQLQQRHLKRQRHTIVVVDRGYLGPCSRLTIPKIVS